MSELFQDLLHEPQRYVDAADYLEGHRFTRGQLEELHLAGLRKRFGELRPAVTVLDRLARENGIESIDSLQDAVPLLFPHTVYKSYPL
jgi:hypothetical protein